MFLQNEGKLTQLCVIVPSLAGHQPSSLGEQPPQHSRLWFGFAWLLFWCVARSEAKHSRLFSASPSLSMSIPLSLSLLKKSLPSAFTLSHLIWIFLTFQVSLSSKYPCCGQLLSDSTSCGHFCPSNCSCRWRPWSIDTSVSVITSHQKGFSVGFILSLSKSRFESQNRWWCVQKWEQHKCLWFT